ncbi:hypothetical protein Xenpb_00020 [Xenorhabdus sp. PB62.4]|nr:hypothetical protein [Xenorhabdus sp. PB62.4]
MVMAILVIWISMQLVNDKNQKVKSVNIQISKKNQEI